MEFSVSAAFHWLPHPVLIVEVCCDSMSSGTQSAVILHGNRMAFDFPEPSIFNISEHRTTGRATVAIAGDFAYRRINDRSTERLHIQELRGGDSYCG